MRRQMIRLSRAQEERVLADEGAKKPIEGQAPTAASIDADIERQPSSVSTGWPNDLAARLHAILNERISVEAADLYESATRALGDSGNPKRVALAGFAMRELMDEMECAAGIENSMIDWRKKILEAAQLREESISAPGVDIDNSEAGDTSDAYDSVLEELFREARDAHSRREIGGAAIDRLDVASGDVAPIVKLWRADVWHEYRQYFNKVLHRKKRPTDPELSQRINAFSDFVINFLQPRPFDHLDEIDLLLESGPPGD